MMRTKNVAVKRTATASAVMIISALSACMDFYDYGHVHPTVAKHTVASVFHGVALDGVGDVYINHLSAGDSRTVLIAADVDIIGKVKTTVDADSVLRIGMTDNKIKYSDGEARVTDRCKNIIVDEKEGCFRGGIEIQVGTPEVKSIFIGKNGSGSIKVARGSAKELLIRHEGKGDIDARDFKADVITIVHMGSGEIKVSAEKYLNVYITSEDGVIRYAGTPIILVPGPAKSTDGVTNPIDPDPPIGDDKCDPDKVDCGSAPGTVNELEIVNSNTANRPVILIPGYESNTDRADVVNDIWIKGDYDEDKVRNL